MPTKAWKNQINSLAVESEFLVASALFCDRIFLLVKTDKIEIQSEIFYESIPVEAWENVIRSASVKNWKVTLWCN